MKRPIAIRKCLQSLCGWGLWLGTVAGAWGALVPAEWPRELRFAVGQPGLVRLDVAPPLLAETRADRSDVRLLGPGDEEVSWRLHRAIAAPLPAISPARSPSESRIEGRRSIHEFETGTEGRIAGLSLITTASRFFKPVTLEGSSDGTWQRLATGVPLYQDYQGATDLRLDFAPGAWTRLRLILDDRRGEPIPIQAVRWHRAPATSVAVVAVPATVRARTDEPGVTRFQLDLGAAGLDVAWLELDTPEPLFTRPVRILAERIAGDALLTEELGRAWVHRVPGDAQTAEESRRLRVERTIPTREIVLLVENGDSPPLLSPSIRVGLYPQRIEFWAAQAGPYRLLAGNAFAKAPNYDISRLTLPAEIIPETITLDGSWSRNPAYREPAAAPGTAGLGAAFDPQGWRYHRTLTVPPGAAEVVELELPSDVIAATREDLADLRLVRAGRQLPYVVDQQALRRKLSVTLTPEPPRPKARSSSWRIDLPQPGVPLSVLRLDTTQATFARPVTWWEVLESRDGERRTNVLAAMEWRRASGVAPRPLELFPASRPSGNPMRLGIDDGDNPPLPTPTATAEYTTRRLLFLSVSGEPVELCYGNPEAGFPRYDLALLLDRLAASTRVAASLGPPEERRVGWGDRVRSGPGLQLIFWGVLAGVVAVLLVVIRKLLPAPPAGGGRDPST